MSIADFIQNLDAAVLSWAMPIGARQAGIWLAVTNLMHPLALTVFSLALLAYLYKKKRYAELALFAIAEIGGYGLHLLVKEVIQRPRPPVSLIVETGFSFPSGHATMSAIFFCLLYFLLRRDMKSAARRRLLLAGCITMIILIGASRVFLGVHWLSDVVAGWLLGGLIFIIAAKYGAVRFPRLSA